MRKATITSAMLLLFAATNGVAQSPLMLADAVLLGSEETPKPAPRLISAAHFLRAARVRIGQSEFGEWHIAPSLTAPLQAPAPAMDVPLSGARSEGAGRLGAMLGWIVGMSVGESLFAGSDLGCNKYGECFGQTDSREAVVAGAVVMGGVGFIGGRILGAVESPEWCDHIPLDGIQIGLAPRGKPGLKISAGLTF